LSREAWIVCIIDDIASIYERIKRRWINIHLLFHLLFHS
jgi:hypothetical protein